MKLQNFYLRAIGLLLIFILAACAAPATPTASATAAATTASTAAPTGTTASTVAPTGSPAATLAATATGASAQGGSVGAACMNDYFPVSAGATWTYASTGSIAGAYTYTRTLSALASTSFTVQDVFNAGVTRTVKWTCAGGDLTPLSTGTGNASVTTATTTMTIDSVDASGYTVPAAFDAGKTWAETLTLKGAMVRNGANQGSAVNVTQINCTANAPESVTVTAGTFDAVKDTCDTISTVTITLAGITASPVKVNEQAIEWYAKGVGLVKSQNSGDGGDEVIQLTQYKIP